MATARNLHMVGTAGRVSVQTPAIAAVRTAWTAVERRSQWHNVVSVRRSEVVDPAKFWAQPKSKGEESQMKRILGITAAAGLAIGASTPVMAADVVIGVPNWPSVKVTAHVLKVVLEDNLGLSVELQNGTIRSSLKRWIRAPCMSIPKSGCRTKTISTTKFVKTKKPFA